MSNSFRYLVPISALALVVSCSPGPDSMQGAEQAAEWPAGLVSPIHGATFSLVAGHLPGAHREYRSGTHQGFDFSNGFSGRIIPTDTTAAAVANGEVIRIDRQYSAPPAEALRYWAGIADSPGPVGDYALDQLRGRQVWIRHEEGHVSRYAHLAQVHPELAPGDFVEKGQPVGMIGASGLPPTEDQPEPAPHLHFELWSPDGSRYLGQGLSPYETHRLISSVFGREALPRFARQAIADVERGEPVPEPYPPESLPESGFTVNPPAEVAVGQAFAAPITWEGDTFRAGDFFAMLEGARLGIIDAGDGAWILGTIPLGLEAEEVRLTIGAVDPYGHTPVGQRAISTAPPTTEAPAPMEVETTILEQYDEESLRLEEERLGAASLSSIQRGDALWEAEFQAPLEGRVVGEFGQPLVAGPLAPSFPRPGFLIQPSDSEASVRAANTGIVALVEELPIRGRTVVIEHGGGVISVYAHLASVDVEVGDNVEKGQAIGSVGQTGAIDDHLLRWEIHVAGIPSDPRAWLGKLLPGR